MNNDILDDYGLNHEQFSYAYGRPWRRLLAFLVDNLLALLLWMLLMFIVGIPSHILASIGVIPVVDAEIVNALATAGLFLVHYLYFAKMESGRRQGTWAKHWLQLRVVSSNYEPISFMRATARYFAKVICLLTLGLGFIYLIINVRRQTLADIIAATVVIEK
jgi:uncharacterized RDD family membrane protein YckC